MTGDSFHSNNGMQISPCVMFAGRTLAVIVYRVKVGLVLLLFQIELPCVDQSTAKPLQLEQQLIFKEKHGIVSAHNVYFVKPLFSYTKSTFDTPPAGILITEFKMTPLHALSLLSCSESHTNRKKVAFWSMKKFSLTHGSSGWKDAVEHVGSQSHTDHQVHGHPDPHHVAGFVSREDVCTEMDHRPKLIFSFSTTETIQYYTSPYVLSTRNIGPTNQSNDAINICIRAEESIQCDDDRVNWWSYVCSIKCITWILKQRFITEVRFHLFFRLNLYEDRVAKLKFCLHVCLIIYYFYYKT